MEAERTPTLLHLRRVPPFHVRTHQLCETYQRRFRGGGILLITHLHTREGEKSASSYLDVCLLPLLNQRCPVGDTCTPSLPVPLSLYPRKNL